MSAAQSAILPDHVLAAVFAIAERELIKNDPSKTRLDFRSHNFFLQEIFSEIQREKRYPILDAFVYSDCGPDPYSPVLDESVSRLQLSGLIGRENPDYEVVFLQPAAKQFYEEVLRSEFSDPELQVQLTDIARQFLHRVGKA